jgi:transcriptional regulator with XRE-family HTH domain
MSAETIGSALLKRRLELGLEKGQAADKIGMSRTTYSSYEQDTQRPSVDVFPALSSFLVISIEELLVLYGATCVAGARSALERTALSDHNGSEEAKTSHVSPSPSSTTTSSIAQPEAPVAPSTAPISEMTAEAPHELVTPSTAPDSEMTAEARNELVTPSTAPDSEVTAEARHELVAPSTAPDSEVTAEAPHELVTPSTAPDSEVTAEARHELVAPELVVTPVPENVDEPIELPPTVDRESHTAETVADGSIAFEQPSYIAETSPYKSREKDWNHKNKKKKKKQKKN